MQFDCQIQQPSLPFDKDTKIFLITGGALLLVFFSSLFKSLAFVHGDIQVAKGKYNDRGPAGAAPMKSAK